jgi:hypothetical protein
MSIQFKGNHSIFDDRGEVKSLVNSVVQKMDPHVTVESLRKLDFSYVLSLSRKDKIQELELTREEVDASWGWRSGSIDEGLIRKIEEAIHEF